MTTAFAYAARGELRSAFLAQPMGAALALACAAGFWTALHAAVFSSRAGWIAQKVLLNRATLVSVVVLSGVAWAYKVWAYTPQNAIFPAAAPSP